MRAIDADKLLRDIEKYHVSDGKFQHWVQIQPTIEPEPCEDVVSRQGAIDAVLSLCDDCNSDHCGSCRVNFPGEKDARKALEDLAPAQKKGYTKADYIMALHKEYGCSLARAEEAYQKALEYLRNTSMMKG